MKVNIYNDYEKDKKEKFNKIDKKKKGQIATNLVDESVQKENAQINRDLKKYVDSTQINRDGIEQLPIEQEATNIPEQNVEQEQVQICTPVVQQPKMVEVHNETRVLKQRLSKEEVDKFVNKPLITDEEIAIHKCNHVSENKIDAQGMSGGNPENYRCNICHAEFSMRAFSKENLELAQKDIMDAIEQLKIFGNYNDKDYMDLVRAQVVVSKIILEYFK